MPSWSPIEPRERLLVARLARARSARCKRGVVGERRERPQRAGSSSTRVAADLAQQPVSAGLAWNSQRRKVMPLVLLTMRSG